MRPLLAIALVLIGACGRSDRADVAVAGRQSPSATTLQGPDALVLRVPRQGGIPHVDRYPRLDQTVWRASSAAPAIERILGFDPDAGLIAFVDQNGRPGRIDLRLGEIMRSSKTRLESPSSDGSAIYGISGDEVVRYTPAEVWRFKPARPASAVFAQPDGSVLVVAKEGEPMLWRLRPPATEVSDSLALPKLQRAVGTAIGDQLYLVVDEGIVPVRTRTMELLPTIAIPGTVSALASTPSGDRLFVVDSGTTSVSVVDRYRGRVERKVELPGEGADLRMDRLGRFLLVRAAAGDSAWVVALGTGQVLGSVRSAWRPDLPFVAPDGAVALAQGQDVAFVDGETLRPIARVANGANDFWYAFSWNGFRPRDASLDRPATFPVADSDSVARADSAAAAAAAGDTSSRAPAKVPPPNTPPPPGEARP